MKLSQNLNFISAVMTKAEQRKFFLATVLALVISVIDIVGLWVLLNLITFVTASDSAKNHQFFTSLIPGHGSNLNFFAEVLAIAFIFLFKAFLAKLILVYQKNVIAEVDLRIQSFLYNYYTKKDFDFLKINDLSSLSHNILKIFLTINNFLPSLLVLIGDGLLVILLILFFLLLEPAVILAASGFAGLFWFMFRFFRQSDLDDSVYERQKLEENRFRVIEETFLNLREIRVFAKQSFFHARFFSSARQHSAVNRKIMVAQGMPSIYMELLTILSLLVVVFSVWSFQDNFEFLDGFLILFAGCMLRVLPSINRIVLAIKQMNTELPMIELLNQISSDQTTIISSDPTHNSIKFHNRVEIRDLSYSHSVGSALLFNNSNLAISKGSKVCIVGKTGVGKSTFIDILLGLRSPTSGKITVDGIDINCNIESWRKLIGYVPANIVLLNLPIRNNIAFGVDENKIDDERVNLCIEVVQLAEYIQQLPGGIFYSVGERGSNLSTGQRQKVGFARALYFDPSILILDEATSALDIETEELIFQTLNSAVEKLTILSVSHRISALKNFDYVYTLKDKNFHLSV